MIGVAGRCNYQPGKDGKGRLRPKSFGQGLDVVQKPETPLNLGVLPARVCGYLAVSRNLVSYCKASHSTLDTVEVRSSSLLVTTISSSDLRFLDLSVRCDFNTNFNIGPLIHLWLRFNWKPTGTVGARESSAAVSLRA
jgi:hypothetical protein